MKILKISFLFFVFCFSSNVFCDENDRQQDEKLAMIPFAIPEDACEKENKIIEKQKEYIEDMENKIEELKQDNERLEKNNIEIQRNNRNCIVFNNSPFISKYSKSFLLDGCF